ncbi:MAG: hypothetical protein HKM97_07195, partial [Acidimicrobiia bacterium]|nr:hypothetical protein [Acidimicrobiia bacterium]
TTTTTVKPTTTTTTTKPPPTTTTTSTVPPTTTTTTTTTTTVPPTTTTTIPLPGLLVHKFDGHDHGDDDEWEAHIKIEIRDEFDDDAGYAAVRVTWGGVAPGSMWLGTDKDGKVDTRLGPFADASLTFRIANVTLTGFVYRPSLNEAGTTLLIEGPD